MSEETKIEWATSTGNPWIGCTKVSPGCANCYAAELDRNRFSRTMGGGTKENPVSHWGKGAPRFRTKGFWKDAIKWNEAEGKYADAPHLRPRIFPSLCDWLDDEVPIEWLADFLKLIKDTPNLDWLLLTKRPENWRAQIESAVTLWEDAPDAPEVVEEMTGFLDSWLDCIDMPERGDIPQNIWIGASVEDQQRADERIPALLKIPAKIRFLSCEPLLGPIDMDRYFYANQKNGEHCLSIRNIGNAENNSRGPSVEIQPPSGEQVRQIHVCAGDVEQSKTPSTGTQAGVEALQWGDTGRDGNKSQERNETRQPARKLGGGNLFAELDSRHQNTESGKGGPIWGKKLHGEIDRQSSDSNSGEKDCRGAAKEHSEGLQHIGSECISNSPGASVGGIGWLICGGESGKQARRCNIEWIRSIVKQCQTSSVPVFVKQLGGNLSDADLSECDRATGKSMAHPKGGDPSEWPEDLRVREFPI